MNAPTNTHEALRLALFLALTAPDDTRAAAAAAVAEQLADGLPMVDVARASVAAMDWAQCEAITHG